MERLRLGKEKKLYKRMAWLAELALRWETEMNPLGVLEITLKPWQAELSLAEREGIDGLRTHLSSTWHSPAQTCASNQPVFVVTAREKDTVPLINRHLQGELTHWPPPVRH